MNEDDYKHKEPLRCQLLPITQNLKPICGHKLDTTHIPKRNCDTCWKLFFIKNQDMTRQNMQVMLDGGADGEAAIVQKLGSKYIKQVKRFAVFIHDVMKAQEAREVAKEIDGNERTEG